MLSWVKFSWSVCLTLFLGWYYIGLNYIVLYWIALHWITLNYIALYCIVLHCITLYCIVLHCLALHCIVLKFHCSGMSGSCLTDWDLLFCLNLRLIWNQSYKTKLSLSLVETRFNFNWVLAQLNLVWFSLISDSDSDSDSPLTLVWLGCYKNIWELRNSNGFNLVTIWLISEIDQSGSSWSELDQ